MRTLVKQQNNTSKTTQIDKLVGNSEKLLLGGLLVASLLCVLIQVGYRILFDGALAWTDEASRLSMIWMTFIGAAYLMNKGKHLAVDALVTLFNIKAKMVFEVLSNVIVVATCGTVFISGIAFVDAVRVSDSAGLSISMAWFYGAALLGMLIVSLHGVLNSVKVLRTGQPVYSIASETVTHESFEGSDEEIGAAK